MDEPDRKLFLDKDSGLPCLIIRHNPNGHLCGYVGLSEGHPFFDQEYNSVPSEYHEVHGGLTFSRSV